MFNFKKFTALILSLLMIICSFEAAVIADSSEEDTKVIIDSTNIANLSKNNQYSSVSTEVFRLSDKSLKLSGDGTTSGSSSSESKRYEFPEAQDWSDFNYINILAVNESEDAKFRLDATLDSTNASAAIGHWYKDGVGVKGSGWQIVSVALSSFKQAYTGATEPGDKYTEMNNIEGIFFDGITNTLYVEKIWLSKEIPPETALTGSNPENGCDDVSVNEKNVTFFFSGTLADEELQSAEVTVTAGSEPIEDFTVTYTPGSVTVGFDNTLEFGTTYALTLTGIMNNLGADAGKCEISFTTSDRALSASSPVLTDENGEKLSALPESGVVASETTVYNPEDADSDATLVLAVYDENGRMDMNLSKFESAKVPAGESISLKAQLEAESYSGLSVYAFVVDNLSAKKLLTPDFAKFPEDEVTDETEALDGNSDTLTLNSFDFSNDTATLDASINGGAKRTLLLSLESDNNLKHIIPIKAKNNGSAIASCKMTDSDSSGTYTLTLSGRKINNTVSEEFYHLSEKDKADVFDIANSLKNEDEAVSMLKDYSEVFLLEDSTLSDETLLLMTAEAICSNKPFEDFEDLKSFVKEAEKVCSGLNSNTWDTLAGYLMENKEVLLGTYNLSYFEDLSATKRNKVCKLIDDLEFSSLKDLEDKLSDAIDDYKASLKSNSGKSSGGGGGGGGGYKLQTPVMPEVSTPEAPIIKPATPENAGYEFTDIGDFGWAKESINLLTSEGIISKPSDKMFRPGDMITRGEFVKLLVCALYADGAVQEAEFTDVTQSDWCYPYVAKAFQNGLITGRADGSFGKNDPITRQEMAAVIHRAIITKKINIPSSLPEYSYSDDNQIADYAKDAVYALYHTGIMSGMGENNFAPDENANRAQAACVIHRVLKGADNE